MARSHPRSRHYDRIDKDQIEERLTSGILGQWYVVAKSVQVKRGKPHAVKALGRNLVLWRDGARQARIASKTTARIAARGSRAARSTATISPAAITA